MLMTNMLRDIQQIPNDQSSVEAIAAEELASMTSRIQHQPMLPSTFGTNFPPPPGGPLGSTPDAGGGLMNPMPALPSMGMFQPQLASLVPQAPLIKTARQKSDKQREKEREKARDKEMKYQAAMEAALGGPQGASEGRPAPYISSQGCSRVFIVKILIIISNFVRGKRLPSIFTFDKDILQKWIEDARTACCSPTYQEEEEYFGGCTFVYDDPATHWLVPGQLFSWWKNNLERKVKLKILEEDASYMGMDPRRIARARWCESVIALARVIRTSASSTSTGQRFTTFAQLKEEFETKSDAVVKVEGAESSSVPSEGLSVSSSAPPSTLPTPSNGVLASTEASSSSSAAPVESENATSEHSPEPAGATLDPLAPNRFSFHAQALSSSAPMGFLPSTTALGFNDLPLAIAHPVPAGEEYVRPYGGLLGLSTTPGLTNTFPVANFSNLSAYPTSMGNSANNMLNPTEQARREAELTKPFPYMDNLPAIHTWLTRHFVNKCLDGEANIANLGFKNHLDALRQLRELNELIAQGHLQDRFKDKDKGKDKDKLPGTPKERGEKKPRGRKPNANKIPREPGEADDTETGEEVGSKRKKPRGSYRKRRTEDGGDTVEQTPDGHEGGGNEESPKGKKRRGRPPANHNPMIDLFTAIDMVEGQDDDGGFSPAGRKSKAKLSAAATDTPKRGGRGPGRNNKKNRYELSDISLVEEEEEESIELSYKQKRAVAPLTLHYEYGLNLLRATGTLHFMMEFTSQPPSSTALVDLVSAATAIESGPPASSSVEAGEQSSDVVESKPNTVGGTVSSTTAPTPAPTPAPISAKPATWKVFGPLHSRLELGRLSVDNLKWRSANQTKEYFSLFEGSVNKDFLSPSKHEETEAKVPKIGDKHQADLPELSELDDTAKSKLDAKEAKEAIKTIVWSPDLQDKRTDKRTSASKRGVVSDSSTSVESSSGLFPNGTVMVMRYNIPDPGSSDGSNLQRQRLVCIVKPPSRIVAPPVKTEEGDELTKYTVFDGAKYYAAAMSDLVALHSTDDLDPDKAHRTALDMQWTLEEVETMAEQIRQHGDSLRPVWLAVRRLSGGDDSETPTLTQSSAHASTVTSGSDSDRRVTFAHVVDFYHRIYFLGKQNGGIKRLLALYQRAERARLGLPDSSSEDDDDDDEDDDEEEDEDEDDGESGSEDDDAGEDDANSDRDEEDGDDQDDEQGEDDDEDTERDQRGVQTALQAHAKALSLSGARAVRETRIKSRSRF